MNKVPQLDFRVLFGNTARQYGWIKNNPDFSTIAKYSPEELFTYVKMAAEELSLEIKKCEQKLINDLTQHTGFGWREDKIIVYPTFLWPSFSDPLTIRVVDVLPKEIKPRSVNLNLGVLLHELGHNLVPFTLFETPIQAEEAMDLLAMKVLDENGYDGISYKQESAKASGYTQHTLNVDKLFNPTIKKFLS